MGPHSQTRPVDTRVSCDCNAIRQVHVLAHNSRSAVGWGLVQTASAQPHPGGFCFTHDMREIASAASISNRSSEQRCDPTHSCCWGTSWSRLQPTQQPCFGSLDVGSHMPSMRFHKGRCTLAQRAPTNLAVHMQDRPTSGSSTHSNEQVQAQHLHWRQQCSSKRLGPACADAALLNRPHGGTNVVGNCPIPQRWMYHPEIMRLDVTDDSVHIAWPQQQRLDCGNTSARVAGTAR